MKAPGSLGGRGGRERALAVSRHGRGNIAAPLTSLSRRSEAPAGSRRIKILRTRLKSLISEMPKIAASRPIFEHGACVVRAHRASRPPFIPTLSVGRVSAFLSAVGVSAFLSAVGVSAFLAAGRADDPYSLANPHTSPADSLVHSLRSFTRESLARLAATLRFAQVAAARADRPGVERPVSCTIRWQAPVFEDERANASSG